MKQFVDVMGNCCDRCFGRLDKRWVRIEILFRLQIVPSWHTSQHIHCHAIYVSKVHYVRPRRKKHILGSFDFLSSFKTSASKLILLW